MTVATDHHAANTRLPPSSRRGASRIQGKEHSGLRLTRQVTKSKNPPLDTRLSELQGGSPGDILLPKQGSKTGVSLTVATDHQQYETLLSPNRVERKSWGSARRPMQRCGLTQVSTPPHLVLTRLMCTYLVDPASSICLFQRLSHARLSTTDTQVKPRMAH